MSAFWSQFCIEKSRWERESCPLSGIEKRPPLGGYVSIKVMLDTIRNTRVVRCREAVLFSEGPLSEARLPVYSYSKLAVILYIIVILLLAKSHSLHYHNRSILIAVAEMVMHLFLWYIIIMRLY